MSLPSAVKGEDRSLTFTLNVCNPPTRLASGGALEKGMILADPDQPAPSRQSQHRSFARRIRLPLEPWKSSKVGSMVFHAHACGRHQILELGSVQVPREPYPG